MSAWLGGFDCTHIALPCALCSRHHDDRSDSDDERAERKASKKSKKESKDKERVAKKVRHQHNFLAMSLQPLQTTLLCSKYQVQQ